jgi:hypothetical protein
MGCSASKEKPVMKEKVVKKTVAPVVDSSKGVSSVKARVRELKGKGKALVPVDHAGAPL